MASAMRHSQTRGAADTVPPRSRGACLNREMSHHPVRQLQRLAEQVDRHRQAHRGPSPCDRRPRQQPKAATEASTSADGSWAMAAPVIRATWVPADPARSP